GSNSITGPDDGPTATRRQGERDMTRAMAALALLLLTLCPPATATEPPRLVVQVTVDQLRGDLPLRYRDRFALDGFRRFLEHGTWYAAARHGHADTETVVGHTTLATGTDPSRHGLVANVWFDREAGRLVGHVADPTSPVLSVDGEEQSGPGAS